MNMFISWFPLLLILGLFALWVRLIVRANRRARAHMEKRFYPYPSAQERARQRREEEDEFWNDPNNLPSTDSLYPGHHDD